MKVPHHLGGSYASSVHGLPRQTQDVDFVAELTAETAAAFADRLRGEFYVDPAAAARAARGRNSFNLIHLESAIKVDVFILGDDPFDRVEMERSREIRLDPAEPSGVPVKSPEDTVLRKLRWFRDGGETSERQWLDVLGVLRVQGARLDRPHMQRWATHLGVADLLDRALRES